MIHQQNSGEEVDGLLHFSRQNDHQLDIQKISDMLSLDGSLHASNLL